MSAPGSPPENPAPDRRHFASDNASGAAPQVLEALVAANAGHAIGYGHDEITRRATAALRRELGEPAGVAFVFGGTAANVIALSTAVGDGDAVLCAESSHLWRDECAAPERFLGAKLLPLPAEGGKLRPEDVRPRLADRAIVHRARPAVLSITQPTELGTVYTLEELAALGKLAREEELVLHVDGARLAGAAARLDCPLAEAAGGDGADLISLGGTKHGLVFGEAVIVRRPELAARLGRTCKQAMQLPSKMRFVAAQFEALLKDGLWLELARRANAAARRLGEGLGQLPGVELLHPVESNAVFCRLPDEAVGPLQAVRFFHRWDGAPGTVRLMTSFDTTDEDVDELLDAARKLLA